MVGNISTWAQNIVVAVIVITILEMIIPDGNNKKYIRMVMGIFILFVIIAPVLSNFSNIDEFKKSIWNYEEYLGDKELELGAYNTMQTSNQGDIETMYLTSLNSDISERLKEKGYTVISVNADAQLKSDNSYGKVKRIELKVMKNNLKTDEENNNIKIVDEISVETISIQAEGSNEEQKSNLSDSDKDEIKQYLANTYDMNKNNIVIN